MSVSYTAVNLAEDSLDKPLSEATVLILGAGTMSELTATHLQAKGVKPYSYQIELLPKRKPWRRNLMGKPLN